MEIAILSGSSYGADGKHALLNRSKQRKQRSINSSLRSLFPPVLLRFSCEADAQHTLLNRSTRKQSPEPHLCALRVLLFSSFLIGRCPACVVEQEQPEETER